MPTWIDTLKFGDGIAGNATNPSLGDSSPFRGTAGQYTGTNIWGWNIGNTWMCLLHQIQKTGAWQHEINEVVSSNTSTGVITFKYPLQYTYGVGAQITLCQKYQNIEITGTQSPPVFNHSYDTYGGIAFLVAKEIITITGTLSANGCGFLGGRQNDSNGNYQGIQGDGYGGGYWNRSIYSNGNGGGGGGANSSSGGAGGGGGGGGYITAGANGNGVGYGGATGTLVGMGGGGGGGGNDDAGGFPGSAGGNGGGLLYLMAKKIIVNGYITSNGNNGANSVSTWGGCGGGGAGGCIYLKAQYITAGTNKLTAYGGSGGTGGNGGAGGAGGSGLIYIEHFAGYSGSSSSPSMTVYQNSNLKSNLIMNTN